MSQKISKNKKKRRTLGTNTRSPNTKLMLQ